VQLSTTEHELLLTVFADASGVDSFRSWSRVTDLLDWLQSILLVRTDTMAMRTGVAMRSSVKRGAVIPSGQRGRCARLLHANWDLLSCMQITFSGEQNLCLLTQQLLCWLSITLLGIRLN